MNKDQAKYVAISSVIFFLFSFFCIAASSWVLSLITQEDPNPLLTAFQLYGIAIISGLIIAPVGLFFLFSTRIKFIGVFFNYAATSMVIVLLYHGNILAVGYKNIYVNYNYLAIQYFALITFGMAVHYLSWYLLKRIKRLSL
jgi:hypothetical protein